LKKHLLFATLVLVMILSACGAPAPVHPTRAQELDDTGLIGRHPIQGVNVENGYQGNFDGGFFLFGGGASGQINPATNYIIKWYPRENVSYTTTVARSKIVTNTVVYTAEHPGPEIEFVFAQEWLDQISTSDPYAPIYSAEDKLDLNKIIDETYKWGTSALIIVNIYISAEDQAGINHRD